MSATDAAEALDRDPRTTFGTHAVMTFHGPAGESVVGYIGPQIFHPGEVIIPYLVNLHAALPDISAAMAGRAQAADYPRVLLPDHAAAAPGPPIVDRVRAVDAGRGPKDPLAAAFWLYFQSAVDAEELAGRRKRPRIAVTEAAVEYGVWYGPGAPLEASYRTYDNKRQVIAAFDQPRQPVADVAAVLSVSATLRAMVG